MRSAPLAAVALAALALAPAAALDLAETPRSAAPALTPPVQSLPAGAGVPGLGAPVSILDAWLGRLPQLPGLPTSPALRLAAPPSPASPAASPEGLPGAPAAAPSALAQPGAAALGASAVGPQRAAPPLGALGPVTGPGRFRPAPLDAGVQAQAAASASGPGRLSALGRQAAQTLGEVRALPQADPGEGARRLGRRLWEREPSRGSAERTTRIEDPGERRGGASAGGAAGGAPGPESADAAVSARDAARPGASESFESAALRAYGMLRPAGPDVVGRRVAPPEAVPAPAFSGAAEALPASHPPVSLVALRVAGDALVLTERLAAVPASPLAVSGALAALPYADAALSDGRALAVGAGMSALGPELRSFGGVAPASAASATYAPADAWSVAEGAPSFDAGDPGAVRARVPQRQDVPPARPSAQLASAQPWIWLLPMALLAFRYRREYL